MVSKARACGTFTQSGFQTHEAGKQGDTDMKKAGSVAGYVHRPPLPFKLKARPCVRNQLESIKTRGRGWVGGWMGTVGRRPTPPEKREPTEMWMAAWKWKKEPNKIRTPSLFKPSVPSIFTSPPFLFCLACQWHREPTSNGENHYSRTHLQTPNQGLG